MSAARAQFQLFSISAFQLFSPAFSFSAFQLRRLQNLLRRFCKRRIQKSEFSIQNGNPLTGNVYYYSDS